MDREKTVQLKKRRNCFSEILPRQQIYLWISSRGGRTKFAQSSTHRSAFGSELLHPPVKWNRTVETVEGSKLHIRNLSAEIVLEPKSVWLLIILTPTGSSWSSHTVKTQKGKQLERCADDSLRGTRHILFFFVFVFFLLSLKRVKV